MTPRQRVEAVLKGQPVDKVPFSCYHFLIYAGEVERQLRNQGMCYIIYRGIDIYETENPGVTETGSIYTGADGILRQKITLETPAGVLTETGKLTEGHFRVPMEQKPFKEEFLFKSPDDYRPIMELIANRQNTENHAAFARAQQEVGEDDLVVSCLPYSPLQEVMIEIMGLANFSREWHARRNRVLELFEVVRDDHRAKARLAAEYPGFIPVHVDGNQTPMIIGPERFRDYYIPYYNEIADLLRDHGKLSYLHCDDNIKLFAEDIAACRVDCIEAFDPNNDMSVAQARAMWPDKILWLNFPSAEHLNSPKQVAERTRQILKEAAPLDRFLMGVTENVPHYRWPVTLPVISEVLDREARFD